MDDISPRAYVETARNSIIFKADGVQMRLQHVRRFPVGERRRPLQIYCPWPKCSRLQTEDFKC